MANFTFGERSERELSTADPRLVQVMRKALELSEVDFGIVQGARTIEQQREYFKAGNSKVNPDAYSDKAKLYAAAKHITGPGMPHSRAVDIIIGGKKSYDAQSLAHVAGVVLTVAKYMGIPVRWGGNWDHDSEIVTDQSLVDMPHFELV